MKTKKSDFIGKVLSLILVLFIGGSEVIYSQTLNQQRTLTPSEMIYLFKTKSKSVNLNPQLKGLNLAFESETGYPCVLSSKPCCPLLPITGIKGYYGEWVLEDMLYLKKIKGDNAGVCKVYEDALIQKYGKTVKGIPAKWFTGELTDYQSPIIFLEDTITSLKLQIRIKNGKITERKINEPRDGVIVELWNEKYTSNQDGKVKISIYRSDDIWTNIYYYNALGLSAFMNDRADRIPKDIYQKEEFSILVVNGNDGKAQIYLLSPSNPNKNINRLYNLLKEFSKELPLWCIDGLETFHGTHIPGCFLQILYDKHKWYFTNYLKTPPSN